MAAEFNRAVAHFIATCAYVTAVHDLVTKWRLELVGRYILDLYFNETLGKYGYTMVQARTRVLGWDNAPHHPGLANFPHHVHRPDGQIEPSALTGDPDHDLEQARLEIEAFLAQ
ncbi:MAG: DUF6516 family protein [Anaerolineae bacterium]